MLKKEAKSWAPARISKSVQARDRISDVKFGCLVLDRTSAGRSRVVKLPFPFLGVMMAVVEALGGKGAGEGWRGARVQSRLGGYILA